MSTTGEQLVSAELPSPKSFVERFVGVFTSPGETFADIGRKPDFIAPLIVLVLSIVAVTETMLWKIGLERIIRFSLEQFSVTSKMTPEQKQQAVEQGSQGFRLVLAHVQSSAGVLIFLLAVAGIGLFVATVVFGAPINYKTSFSVTCYAFLVSIVSTLMGIALILFGDPEHFNVSNFVPSNPGFFLNPQETSKPLYALLSSLDIFSFWFMALLGIGFSEASGRKLKAISVFLIFFGFWVLLTLIKMGLAVAFG